MNGEDLADKAGIKKENRFIFSDSYYENMPEIPEKPNFDVLGLPKKETPSSNQTVQQASSFDQIVHNDYTKNDVEPSNHMFNFFSGADSNETSNIGNLGMAESKENPLDTPSPFLNQEEQVNLFDSFGKKNELDSAHGINEFQEKTESEVSASSSMPFGYDSFGLPSTDLDPLKLGDSNSSFSLNDSLQTKEDSSNGKEDLSTNESIFSTESSLPSSSNPDENHSSTLFNFFKKKNRRSDSIHEENNFEKKPESQETDIFAFSRNPFEDSFSLPSTDLDSSKTGDSNSSFNLSDSLQSREISSNDKEELPTSQFSFSTESSNPFDFNEMNSSAYAPADLNSLPVSQEKTEVNEKIDSTANIFSNDKSNDSFDFYKPEEHSNNDYFFGNSSGTFVDIENEKTTFGPTNSIDVKPAVGTEKKEEDPIDFIERLKNQESSLEASDFSDDSTTSSQFAIPVDQMEDQKDFLWKSIEKTPMEEIKVPERKLEYDQNFMSSTPIEENRFIVNGDPSIEIKELPKREIDKIPDFMSGTFQASDLNISTGVNQELEAELLKQREEEEERKQKEALETGVYQGLNKNKKNQRLVYKAGGKSYVREVESKPKIELWPANQPSTSSSTSSLPQVEEPSIVTKQEPIDLKSTLEITEEVVEEPKKEEPKSIQELIENIVDVPGLSNIEVELNPFENPGVKFGFQEKIENEMIPEDQPTNVYDEKEDNFDYDQNFENVEVVKSTLLEELIGKSHKEGRISILARYGEDFCARDYITNPAIGRAEEIKQLILILLTPEKSGILIGKPGIGKTSIVEGLAYQLQRNNVPEALKGFRIVSVKTPSLLGSLPTGETRLQTLVDELKELDKVILFIDEIHMLIGATNDSSMDFANMFKESLGRGTIKVIGATTTEEYERYVLRDKAFVRRFQKVEVEEPSREHTIKILMGTLPKIEKTTGAKLKYSEFMQTEIMSFIVDITTEYKRIYGIGSRYPDICLTLLSQAFSQAVFANRTEVTINDIRKAIENSKNIYPDVIRKELVNFDRKFKDLMREEELGQ